VTTQRCPDDEACHHDCVDHYCWRVLHTGPLSGVYIADHWPLSLVRVHEARRPAEETSDE
jgi:N-formylglutamate amidohydrolase